MEWTRGPVIGQGSTATVSLAANAISGDLFAVKSTELSRSLPLQKEQSLLSSLSPSSHVVKYFGCNVTEEDNNLVYNLCVEYVAGGTLHELVRSRVRGFLDDEAEIGFYTRGILRGLDHLHGSGIAHCDVKSQNVLVGKDGAKIADLGCGKRIGVRSGFGDCSRLSVFSGTPMFMSPEVARGEEQGFEADVWAVGCTVIEMATGSLPWPGETDPVSVLYRVGFSDDVPEIPGWLSESARDFLEKCLKRDPRQRWTVRELLEHPFVGEMDFESPDKEPTLEPRSPIGVLDRVFWESMEESSGSHIADQLNDEVFDSTSGSFDDRINKLVTVGLELPDWIDHGDWVTVRRSGGEEIDEETLSLPAEPASVSLPTMFIDSISGWEPQSWLVVGNPHENGVVIISETDSGRVSPVPEDCNISNDGSVLTNFGRGLMDIYFLEIHRFRYANLTDIFYRIFIHSPIVVLLSCLCFLVWMELTTLHWIERSSSSASTPT